MGYKVNSVPERLRAGAELFEERNAQYGNNYKSMGAVMAAMYPSGLTVCSPAEWTRLMLQVLRVMKETRYACNFTRGGHTDSLDDLVVYAAMAAETDDLACAGGEASVRPPDIYGVESRPFLHTGLPPRDVIERAKGEELDGIAAHYHLRRDGDGPDETDAALRTRVLVMYDLYSVPH